MKGARPRGTCQDCGQQLPTLAAYAPVLGRNAPPTVPHGTRVEVCPGSGKPSAEWAAALAKPA